MTALPESEAATSLVLNALLLEQAADGVGDGAAVDDRAVDDAVGRDGLGGERGDAEALARRLQLDRLDGARADVETDDRFAFAETKHDAVL